MDFIQRRKQRQEIERRMQAKEGKRKIQRHVRNQQKRLQQYWQLAKRAYRLGDRVNYTKIAKAIAATRQDVNRWERLLVTFELFEAQRDQAQAGGEFMKAFEAMAKSMLVAADPADMARIMQRADMALALADQMEDRLDDLMDMTDETLAEIETEHQGELAEIMAALQKEAEEEIEPGFEDKDLEAVMKQIDEALQRRVG
jgi:hypothetical protein